MGDTLNETRETLVAALNGKLSPPPEAWKVLNEWDALVGRVRELEAACAAAAHYLDDPHEESGRTLAALLDRVTPLAASGEERR